MPVLVQSLRESWRGLVLWAVALVFVMVLYGSFYPLMGTTEGLESLMAMLPKEMNNALGFSDIGSGAGWIQSTFFGLLGLFLLGAACIGWGARAIAGDEEAGMLELTLAHRVSRTQVYVERAVALLVRVLVLGVAVTVTLVVLDRAAELGLERANIVPQLVAYLGVGLLCGVLALAVGAATGIRAYAVGAGAALLAGAFLLNAVGSISEGTQWMHAVSPVSWAYAERPLAHGWDPAGLLLLYGLTIVLAVIGWAVFARRDVSS